MIDLLWYSADRILGQVKGEFQLSLNSVLPKRNIFRQRLRLYNEALSDQTKIKSNMLYQTMQTFMAVSYTDDLSVEFSSREIRNETQANNLQNLAEFDQEEMNVEEMMYWVKWNQYFHGVSLRTLEWRDKRRKCPLWAVRDPKAWIPDPNIMFVDNKVNARFHGFQVEDYIESLMQHEWYDLEALEGLQTDIQWEIQLNKISQLQNRWIIPQAEQAFMTNQEYLKGLKEEVKQWRTKFVLYHHYTRLDNGQPFIITIDGSFSRILRFIPIEAVTKEEEKDPFQIDFPVVLNYFSPYPWDPYGVCVPDLIEDKQRAYSVIMNLNKIKATREALWGLFAYDTNLVKNAADLQVPNPNWPKFIGMDGSKGNLAWAIYEVQTSRVNPDAINFPQVIMNEVFLSTGMDARALGVSGSSGVTAEENQRVQANQNLKLLLNNKVNAWGEKAFRWLRYRCYKEYFSASDEKFVRLNGWLRTNFVKLKKEDFITKEDPEISIRNKSDENAKRQQQLATFSAYFPLAIQDPTKPKLSKDFIERHYLKLIGLDSSFIDVASPPSPEERQAMMDVEMLNRNEDPLPIKDLNEDHLSYIVVYQSALPTQAKFNAIEKRKQALVAKNKMQAQQGQPQGWQQTINSAANTSVWMLQNQAAQQNQSSVKSSSLQAVAQQ